MPRTVHEVLARSAVLRERRHGEAGQGLAEYALILTLVALVVVGALAAVGTAIGGPLNTVAGKF